MKSRLAVSNGLDHIATRNSDPGLLATALWWGVWAFGLFSLLREAVPVVRLFLPRWLVG